MSENELNVDPERRPLGRNDDEVEGHRMQDEPTERRPLGRDDEEPEVEGHVFSAGSPERKTWEADSKRA